MDLIFDYSSEGKITQLVVGEDGNVRGVKLTVTSESKNKSCYRPLQKIIPFEVTPREDAPREVNETVEELNGNAENTCIHIFYNINCQKISIR